MVNTDFLNTKWSCVRFQVVLTDFLRDSVWGQANQARGRGFRTRFLVTEDDLIDVGGGMRGGLAERLWIARMMRPREREMSQ